MFISFEGIDGSGKTTVIRRLNELMNDDGYKTEVLQEPGSTSSALKIRSIIMDDDIAPETEFLLFQAARSELIDKRIKPALDKGKIVICDRYIDSTIAYQGGGRGVEKDIIETLTPFVTRWITPDITFYLRISEKTAQKRMKIRGVKLDKFDDAVNSFRNRVIRTYDSLARNEDYRIVTVDAEKDIDSIVAEVYQHIQDKLKNNTLD